MKSILLNIIYCFFLLSCSNLNNFEKGLINYENEEYELVVDHLKRYYDGGGCPVSLERMRKKFECCFHIGMSLYYLQRPNDAIPWFDKAVLLSKYNNTDKDPKYWIEKIENEIVIYETYIKPLNLMYNKH